MGEQYRAGAHTDAVPVVSGSQHPVVQSVPDTQSWAHVHSPVSVRRRHMSVRDSRQRDRRCKCCPLESTAELHRSHRAERHPHRSRPLHSYRRCRSSAHKGSTHKRARHYRFRCHNRGMFRHPARNRRSLQCPSHRRSPEFPSSSHFRFRRMPRVRVPRRSARSS